MGEVYLADDLNLNRKVALKFLPDAFTGDPERMARFEREAKLLASLNHPNIAAIYGLEQAERKRFLVLELVEGETLAQRLSKGALPVEEALGICRQIAEGLEAAHEKGVIHRDLKPANVMITTGEKVKILDFGLAKALADETQSVDSSQSSTITVGMTRPGTVLGTAAYMSPEQAKGIAVDKRADIWAFGCVLYECLTGNRAFEGKTVTETLAAVLKGEPDWHALPAMTPANIRFVLRSCLEKDTSLRFHHAADLRILIREAHETGEAAAPAKRPWMWIGVAALFIAAFAIVSFIHFREKPLAPSEPVRLQIALPDKVSLASGSSFALSPNGRHLAFTAVGSDSVIRLWVRALDSLEARPLWGTESNHIPPFFWSPDSRFIAFDAGGKLKKIDVSGGQPQVICDLSGNALGGSWNRDGVIIFGIAGRGLMRVSSKGGSASLVTKVNPVRKELGHYFPAFLPDGRHFLFFCYSGTPENRGVYLGSLDSNPEEQNFKQLMVSNHQSIYIPSQDSSPGRLLFLRDQTLLAQHFDDKRLELIGEPLPVAEQVGAFSNYGLFSASTNGVLVYRSGETSGASVRAVWFDRQGKALGTAAESGLNYGLALSPDGARAAISWLNPGQTPVSLSIWLRDFARGTNTHFTFGQGYNIVPIWSRDGSHIIFSSNRDGVYNLYKKPVSGAKEEELLLASSENKVPTSWSSDGRFLMYRVQNANTNMDLWALPLEGDLKPIPFLRTEANELDGRFSPDMRWVAYVSDESGSDEIYVRGFSPVSGGASSESGGKWQISKEGGTGPRWRGDGTELYYRSSDGRIMAVEVTADRGFQSATPKLIFRAPPVVTATTLMNSFGWDVTADGNRFLLVTPSTESSPSPFNVVLNWTALLKK
jgi:serine/threonine protein kinase